MGSTAADGVLYWKNSIDLNGTGEAGVSDRRFQVEGAAVAVIEGAIVNNGGSPIGLQKRAIGTLVLAGNNTYDGGTYVLGGTLVIGAGGTNGTLGAGYVTNLGALAFNRSDAYIVTNLIVGAGGVEQRGAGVLTLTADNTYEGSTTVTNGTLLIQGAQSGRGLITVSGGTLGGVGSVAGPIQVQSGGKLAPGASTGIFTANSNVTMDAGTFFEVELNGLTAGTGYDQLAMGSGTTLTLSTPTLSVVLGFTPAIDDTFQIVNGFSTLSGAFAGLPTSGSTFVAGGTQFKIDYNASDITLTVVPEPATIGTMSLSLLVGALLRRRWRR